VGGEAQGNATRRPDSIAREQAAEVDDVQNVGEVLAVDLKLHIHVIRLVDVRARRRIHLKRRIDAPAGKVDSTDHLLAVFGERPLWGSVDLEGQPGVVLNSARDPEARFYLVAKASAKAVALILRIGKMARERGTSDSVRLTDAGIAHADQEAAR